MNGANTPPALPLRLDGRTVFVAGGGSAGPGWSIGRASSVTYARQGARVCVADRDADSARETVRLIEEEGGEAIVLVGDVSDEADVSRLVGEARDAFGPIDALHYNVGIGKVGGPAQTSAADLARVHAVNVGGLLLMTQAVLPGMKERGRGAIVAISSIAAHRYLGYPHLAYGVTKAAVEQFIRLVALEHAPFGIRANTVVPGLIDTPRIATTVASQFSADDLDEARQARARQVPTGRMGTAWEVAYACGFLLSDAASYVTGTELLVDGGITGKFV
ncbi:SDR family NAD(P)-dependent oxidoreductase [Variovorax rhizosphaerae]|uniref:SDR family NAD(P)-dependent oxidoreductase n=1 Tax=Variovorax rhizosphaerae TaxID=1836200 RepID=A0ABU8WDP1_9BURK